MELFDFFFPEQAMASHLRDLADQGRRKRRHEWLEQRRQQSGAGKHEARIAELESDLRKLSIIVESMLTRLDEKGVITRDDIRRAIQPPAPSSA